MKYIKWFFKYLFSSTNKGIKTITNIGNSNYTEVEQKILDIIEGMVSSADINKIHCDTQKSKYYIVVGNRTLVIDSATNKVFLLIENSDCQDSMYPFMIRESVITDYIDILVKNKSLHTEKIYERVISCEMKFLSNYEEKVKEENLA